MRRPRTKAKTAYGLLSEVRRLILEEPKRYMQGRFIGRVDGVNEADEIACEASFYPRGAPACGTVGCVAGWVATLKRGNNFTYNETYSIAQNTLGLNDEQAECLFNGGAISGEAQTLRYASAGAAHIKRFQARYAAQLKAKKLGCAR